MRLNILSTLLGCQGVPSGAVAVIHTKNGVKTSRTHGHVVGNPSEQGAVEMFGGILICGPEFYPAEIAGRVFVDLGHDRIIDQGTRGTELLVFLVLLVFLRRVQVEPHLQQALS